MTDVVSVGVAELVPVCTNGAGDGQHGRGHRFWLLVLGGVELQRYSHGSCMVDEFRRDLDVINDVGE